MQLAINYMMEKYLGFQSFIFFRNDLLHLLNYIMAFPRPFVLPAPHNFQKDKGGERFIDSEMKFVPLFVQMKFIRDLIDETAPGIGRVTVISSMGIQPFLSCK